MRDGAKATRVLAAEGVEPLETSIAEVGDTSSLRARASRARVVVNLVGPYTRYGHPVIEACVGRRLPLCRPVQVCGFETLLPDLGIELAVEAAALAGERWLIVTTG